jgi:hypothetical protein
MPGEDLRCGRPLFSIVLICSLLSLTAWSEAQPATQGQRLRPPESLQCPRNHLTAFNGRVQFFHRDGDRTVIRLRNDEHTTEHFTLRHAEGRDPTQWFLLRGNSFQQHHWVMIESAPNHLRPDMRAIVWVCDDDTNPVIDWYPSEGHQPLRPK